MSNEKMGSTLRSNNALQKLICEHHWSGSACIHSHPIEAGNDGGSDGSTTAATSTSDTVWADAGNGSMTSSASSMPPASEDSARAIEIETSVTAWLASVHPVLSCYGDALIDYGYDDTGFLFAAELDEVSGR